MSSCHRLLSYIMPRPQGGALSDDALLTCDVCLSVAYIGLKSRTERPRKTKIGTEVAHVTRVLGHHFQGQKVKINLQGRGILWRPPAQLVEYWTTLVKLTAHLRGDLFVCPSVRTSPNRIVSETAAYIIVSSHFFII